MRYDISLYETMPHVSKNKLDKNVNKMLDDLLIKILTSKKPNEINYVQNVLITPTERTMLKKRLGVFLLLNHGYTLLEIAKVLKLTKQTVHRIKLQLYEVPEEQVKYLQIQIEKWNRINDFKRLVKSLQKVNISQAHFRKKLTRV